MWVEIFSLFLLGFFLWKWLSKPENLPPGPWGLPLIGYIPLNNKTLEENLLELRKKNGNSPILSWRMGTKLLVFIFDISLTREAFVGRSFVNRPRLRILGFLGGSDLGLISGNGIRWQNSRRFTLHHLRDLGMGKSSLIPVVQNEAVELVNDLKSRAGKPTKLFDSFKVAALNVIWQMVASKRYTSEDTNLKTFYFYLGEFRKQSDNAILVDFMPWISKVLPKFIFRRILDEDLERKFGEKLRTMLQEDIAEHKEHLDTNDPKDYIDAYLTEMKSRADDPDSTFSEDDLIACASDLFGTGSETVSLCLQWIIFYVASHPEVQTRLQKEIDEVVPKGHLVTLSDKQRLSYTEAVINEVLRHCTFLKFGGLHASSHDTQLGEFYIPKDVIVCRASFWTNMDPEAYDSPSEFRPERFLDKDGKFAQPKQGFFPFGIGKRQCVGECLARVELLVFLTTLVQNIKFQVPEGKEKEYIKPIAITLANLPNPNHKIIMTLR